MTKEMDALFSKLSTISIKNIIAGYDYLGEQINEMYMNGNLDFEMSTQALKNINKDFKILKKYYKGKITINPKTLYMSYQEGTQERFFLECLVKLAEYNHL